MRVCPDPVRLFSLYIENSAVGSSEKLKTFQKKKNVTRSRYAGRMFDVLMTVSLYFGEKSHEDIVLCSIRVVDRCMRID